METKSAVDGQIDECLICFRFLRIHIARFEREQTDLRAGNRPGQHRHAGFLLLRGIDFHHIDLIHFLNSFCR